MAPIRGLGGYKFKVTQHAYLRYIQRILPSKRKVLAGIGMRRTVSSDEIRHWVINNLDRCKFGKTESQQVLRLITII